MDNPFWPLYQLRLRTRELELRLPNEAELVALCRVARAGIHDPETMPFGVAWTDQPSPQFEREFMKFHWGIRGRWSPQSWTLELAVFHDGQPIGCQGINATDFAVLQEVHTGSWLGQAYQGRGLGKQMRAAVLELAFTGLGAVSATSGAFLDNPASVAVSRALGYQNNGIGRMAPRGEPREHLNLRITRQDWQARRYCEVEIVGLAGCRDMFGL